MVYWIAKVDLLLEYECPIIEGTTARDKQARYILLSYLTYGRINRDILLWHMTLLNTPSLTTH